MRTQAEYEADEAHRLAQTLREVETAPLQDRRDARDEFHAVMRDTPALVGERVGWLLEGCYGFGACARASSIAASPRMNRVAALSQLVAALEWRCPAEFARAAWRRLTPPQQEQVNAEVLRAVKAWETEQETEQLLAR